MLSELLNVLDGYVMSSVSHHVVQNVAQKYQEDNAVRCTVFKKAKYNTAYIYIFVMVRNTDIVNDNIPEGPALNNSSEWVYSNDNPSRREQSN